ncbi:MAG: hypothetical protein K1X28_08030 [Parachlamydiales bacterium]|nr:hypothetical protein [Parachlamydiales bacterium]
MSLAEVQRTLNQPPLMVEQPEDSEYTMVAYTHPLTHLQQFLADDGTNANHFFDILKTIYGEDPVARVQRSGLTDKWPVKMQRRHCLETLAAIGHSITLNDLNRMWGQIRQMPADHPIRHFLNIDAPTLNLHESVETLPSNELGKLVGLIRNPLAFLEPQNKRTLWQEIAAMPKTSDKKFMAYTRYEDTMDQLFSQAVRTRPEFPFAPHEHLAKFVAYAKPSTVQTGMIIPVFTNDETVYYKIESHINTQGLHVYLFTPIDGNLQHPAQLVFRGTNGMKSVSRDMDVRGVGKSVFEANASAIVRMVEDYAAKTPGGLKLDISGHSLGGADAQRAVASLVNQIVKEPNGTLANELKDIKLFAFCSPKLDMATVMQWKSNVKTLADLPAPPHIELNFAEHESDLVTRAGDMNIGTANAKFIEANYLLVKSKSGVANTEQHHTAPFFHFGMFDGQTDNRTFLLFQDREYGKVIGQIGELAEKQLAGPADEEGWNVLLRREEALTEEERALAQEAEARLAILDREKAEIEASQQGAARHSWLVWTASIVAQPLKLIAGAITSIL